MTTATKDMRGSDTRKSNRSQKNKPKKKQKSQKQKKWLTAATADPHWLYENSVQEPEAEIDFIDQAWRERRGRLAHHIREDFCGTAISSCAWVKRRTNNTAVGVDIDPEVLEWTRGRLDERLDPKQRNRLQLVQADVLKVKTDPVDCVLAMNFSYYLFKTRKLLRRYFKHVHKSLADDGLFILDAYGGSESFMELEEERDCDGFTYVWDQRLYNPVTGEAVNHIHFRFPDGSELTDAFTYQWRLWTLPEVREVLEEAGFRDVTVYWEGTDEDTEEGNGDFAPTTRGEACEGWIAYIVAEK